MSVCCLESGEVMIPFCVGYRERSHVFSMTVCRDDEKVEIFEGFFIPELEWMISWVTSFLFKELAGMANVVAETKNLLCFVPLRWRLDLLHPITRTDSRAFR